MFHRLPINPRLSLATIGGSSSIQKKENITARIAEIIELMLATFMLHIMFMNSAPKLRRLRRSQAICQTWNIDVSSTSNKSSIISARVHLSTVYKKTTTDLEYSCFVHFS